jgi:hypothetical protein
MGATSAQRDLVADKGGGWNREKQATKAYASPSFRWKKRLRGFFYALIPNWRPMIR